MTEPRERDDAVSRWLERASASQAGQGPTADCLDAETVAAWADGGLSNEALSTVRAHASDCQRCQALLAVMARTESAAGGAVARRPSRRWLGWMVPLAAAAAALVIWVFVPRSGPSPPVAQEGAAAAGQMAANRQAPAKTAPATEEKLAAAKPAGDAFRENARKPQQAGERDQQRRVDELKELKDRRVADEAKADANKKPLAAAPAAAPSTVAPPVAPPPAQVPAARNEALGRLEMSARAALASKEIATPDPQTRWRIRDDVVDKTTDGGKSWAPVATGLAGPFTAGAAPSASVCWLVGPKGLVMLTTDGVTWRRLTFPEATDLSAVRATDARSAVVTTADGHEYTTINGGATWIRRLLQEN